MPIKKIIGNGAWQRQTFRGRNITHVTGASEEEFCHHVESHPQRSRTVHAFVLYERAIGEEIRELPRTH